VLDVAIAGVFLALLVSEIVPNSEMTPHGVLLALSVVMTVPLAWRSTRPGWVAITVCVGLLVSSWVSTGPFAPQLAILPVLVSLYSAASRTRRREALALGAATLALTVAAWLATPEGASDDFWPWMLWAGAWVSGTFVRRRGDVAAQHAARAARLEIEAGTTALASAEAERDRIARELHDVVAHAVSVMVVQAGAERLRLGPEAGRTGRALESIEESGRTALAELRSMLGVMRDGSAESLAPIPGVAEIPDLVQRLNLTGVPTTLVCTPPDLLEHVGVAGGAVGLAAYRIVQEALTNVIRHAGSAPARVCLTRSAAGLTVLVHNEAPAMVAGSTSASGSDSVVAGRGGRGLVGMRQRAEALGGVFESGTQPDGGFTVRAVLPLKPVPEVR
jgi:signal transduction histidine kinase